MLYSLTAGHSGVTETSASIALSAYRVRLAKIAAWTFELPAIASCSLMDRNPDVIQTGCWETKNEVLDGWSATRNLLSDHAAKSWQVRLPETENKDVR